MEYMVMAIKAIVTIAMGATAFVVIVVILLGAAYIWKVLLEEGKLGSFGAATIKFILIVSAFYLTGLVVIDALDFLFVWV